MSSSVDSKQPTKQEREQTALQIFVAVIALIPIVLGIDLVLLGLQGATIQFIHSYRGPIVPELDSTIRFLGMQFIGSGFILLWTIPQLEARTVPFRIIAFSFVLGGFARLISRFTVGAPYSYVSFVNLLEILNGLILLAWHLRITNKRPLSQPDRDIFNVK